MFTTANLIADILDSFPITTDPYIVVCKDSLAHISDRGIVCYYKTE